jgi:L-alanine-DL-glutamate epimerase-like enolase superfamily enzyme
MQEETVTIAAVQADHYRISLPVALSDATHGTMQAFELITVRVRDADGAEGLGYTYTVGTGGGAICNLIARDLAPALAGADATQIEALWQQLWWRVHYVGRGGLAVHAISAIDTALWDLMAKRRGLPLWRLLGGHDPHVLAYAGGIDLQFPLDRLLRQTEDNLANGFRAIKMKVGRDRLREDMERVCAMRELLGPDVPLMVDANMRWNATAR